MNSRLRWLVVLSLLCCVIGLTAFCCGLFAKNEKPGFFNLENLKNRSSLRSVVIIGSGPAGLTAGIYGARGGFNPYVIEGNKPGGLLTETTDVENWPGEELILGPDLIARMHKQAQNLGVVFVSDSIESIDIARWPYKLTLESGDQIYALCIIIATGATPRKLGIPGESEYWGYGVTTCAVCDAPFRKGQDVIVIGGGDSAIEEAIQLAPHARKVTIMVRKEHMRAAARMQDRLAGYANVSLQYNKDIVEVIGEQVNGPHGPIKRVTAVKVYDNKEKTEYIMEGIRGVFLAIGHEPNSQLFCDHIECDNNGYIKPQGRSQRTSKKGIFVAGDVADHSYRQAVTSAGFGCMAMLDAAAFLGEIGFNDAVAEKIESNLYYARGNNESTVLHAQNIQELDDIVEHSKGIVVVDFYGQLCPSCLQMLPAYEQVASEFKDQATFVKVDVDIAEDIVTHFNILSVPCIMIFKDGKPQSPVYKAMHRKELIHLINSIK